ncbi:PFAM Enoyl-CoA hydratase isomerase [Balamuthia mandrillaris]
MSQGRVKLERLHEGKVFLLTMQSGENRFTPSFLAELNRALDVVEQSTTAAALITTGHDRFYSNGVDLEWAKDHPAEAPALSNALQHICARLLTFPMPTFAAINGHCFAGGLMLAFAHDYRLMREDRGWMCLPAIDLHLHLPQGLLSLVSTKLSRPSITRDVVLTGKRYTAQEARQMDMIDWYGPLRDLLPTTLEWAETMAEKAPDRAAWHATKKGLYSSCFALLNEGGNIQGLSAKL